MDNARYHLIENSWANMKCHLRDKMHNYQSVDSAIYVYFGVSIIKREPH